MSEIDDLKVQRTALWRKLKVSHDAFTRVQKLEYKLHCRWDRDRVAWEECDRKLAMLDGRFKIEPPTASGKHRHLPPPAALIDQLTPDQIRIILDRFGIDPDRVNVVEDPIQVISDDEYEEEGNG